MNYAIGKAFFSEFEHGCAVGRQVVGDAVRLPVTLALRGFVHGRHLVAAAVFHCMAVEDQRAVLLQRKSHTVIRARHRREVHDKKQVVTAGR